MPGPQTPRTGPNPPTHLPPRTPRTRQSKQRGREPARPCSPKQAQPSSPAAQAAVTPEQKPLHTLPPPQDTAGQGAGGTWPRARVRIPRTTPQAHQGGCERPQIPPQGQACRGSAQRFSKCTWASLSHPWGWSTDSKAGRQTPGRRPTWGFQPIATILTPHKPEDRHRRA